MGREFGKKTWRTAMDFQPLEKGLGILSELDILEKALDLSKPQEDKERVTQNGGLASCGW
jgi:hypothetical protein